jgi:Tfp pilus assembly protein PilF
MSSKYRASTCLYGLVLGLALGTSPAWAQRAEGEQPAEGAPPAQNLDAVTARTLSKAIELYNMGEFAGARAVLAELNIEKSSPYERSRVEQLLAGMASTEGDYSKAREHLELASASGGLNAQELSSNRFQIAQSYMAEENWAQGAASLESWFETALNPNSSAYYLLAVAYYQQGEESDSAEITARLHDRALPPAIKAVELAEKPQESWMQLVVALLLQKEDYRGAVPWIEQLVELAPSKKSHWLQLSSVYQEIDDSPKALAVTQLAYMAGLLIEDSEIRRLADLLVYNEIPYRGGQILEQAIAASRITPDAALYEKLANCWMAAGEFDKSVPPLTLGAELAITGDLFVRLGEAQVQREDWTAAQSALEKGLSKGGLEDPGHAQLYMGIVLLKLGKMREAHEWFNRARGIERYRLQAEGYIRYIESQA